MNNIKPDHQLIIEGAGCASCVGKIEGALQGTNGVVSAEMNFADRTVQITGTVKTEELIKAVESIGYNAKSIDDSSEIDTLDVK
jgi:Cu+-exporting ATPase